MSAAFPTMTSNLEGHPFSDEPGLTKTEYFAAKAMQALIISKADFGFENSTIARDAFLIAKAMVKKGKDIA